MASAGTFANHGIKIELQLAGEATATEIVNVTSFKVSTDLNREEWVSFNELGWTSNLITSKSMTFALEANYTANDDLHKKLMNIFLGAGSAEHNGHKLIVTLPIADATNTTAAKLETNITLSPSDILGGDSTGISPISIEMMTDGVPTYTEETA